MKTRVISAAVLIAVASFCIFFSPITRVVFFALCGCLCAYEVSKNYEKLDADCTLWVMNLYLIGQAALTLLEAGAFWYAAWFMFSIYAALFSGIISKKVSGKGALYTLSALAYPCVLFGVMMVIVVSELWLETLCIACLSTWTCDSFALFGGKRFGKHKVAPLVSPNKTVEGCVCGALSSLVVGVIIGLVSPIPMWISVLTAFIASTLGQFGDLAESLLKRMIGVKDFGDLIPGHGGMFDRADSLIFSIPAAYFCLLIFGYGV